MKLKQILKDERYSGFVNEEKREKLDKYLANDWKYFAESGYNQDALAILEESIFLFFEMCSGAPFKGLKRILNFQIVLLEDSA